MSALTLDEVKRLWGAASGIVDGGSSGGTRIIDTKIKTGIAPSAELISPHGDIDDFAAKLGDPDAARRVKRDRPLALHRRRPE